MRGFSVRLAALHSPLSGVRTPPAKPWLATGSCNIVWSETMLKNSRLLLSLLLLGMAGGNVTAQSLLPQENRQPQEGEQPFELPRVVGEPRSKVEYEDWMAVQQAEDVQGRAQLAEIFLENYPDSGLTAFAHRALAYAAYDRNDTENFILYGEKALVDLPETPELLAPLAYLYSERRESLRATKYANGALLLLDSMEKPDEMPSIQWVVEKRGLRADAHYALGRSHLEMWTLSVGSPKELRQAVEHLNRTLELDPEHGYAAYRLGFAQLKADNPEAAFEAYARATVVDSPAAAPSRTQLERIHKNPQWDPESEWAQMSIEEILEEERKRLEAKQAEMEQELARLAAEIDKLEQEKEATPPGN